MSDGRPREMKGVGYEIFITLLSLLSVFNLGFLVVTSLLEPDGSAAQEVVVLMDVIITPIFAFDFLYRLLTAHSKREYFFGGWGWADLLAILPLLRIFRIFRVVRVTRQLREYGVTRFAADVADARASATFLLTLFMVIVVLEVAGSLIYYAEGPSPDANIQSASDAVWWGLVTITTVGYGDRYPVTGEGRIIGVFLLMSGIALFSVLTGFIANIFLAPRTRAHHDRHADDPLAVIGAVRTLVDEQDERSEAIRARLDELERAIAAPSAGSASR